MCPRARAAVALLCGALAPIAMASAAEPMANTAERPESLVLVIRFVSADRVKPTTGVVLSADGHILLASDFVAGGGEMYVVDGQVDPVRHGLPVRVVARRNLEGIAIAHVEGLKRPPIKLASSRPVDDEVVQLVAFSDALSLQANDVVTRAVSRVRFEKAHDTLVLQDRTSLPNVTGVIVDACQNLLGLSLARGTPSAVKTGTTTYLWHRRLKSALATLGVVPAPGACDQKLEWPEAAPTPDPKQAEPLPVRTAEGERKGAAPAKTAAVDRKRVPPEPRKTEPRKQKPPPRARPAPRPAAPPEDVVRAAQESLEKLGLYAGPIDGRVSPDFSAAVARFRRDEGLDTDAPLDRGTLQLMKAKIDLGESREAASQLQGRSQALQSQVSELNAELARQPRSLSERLAALGSGFWIGTGGAGVCGVALVWLLLARHRRSTRAAAALFPAITTPFRVRGELPGGEALCCGVVARDGVVDAVIGRANADILVRDQSVGRQHARLQGGEHGVALTDLGSVNGTSINGARCERGRPYPLQPGDTVMVGAIALRFEGDEP